MTRRYLGIFLLSASMLTLQISTSRVLSVALWYHFGFLVISTALLGLGAAGAALAGWPRLRDRAPLERTTGVLAALFGLVTAASHLLLQQVPFAPFSLLEDRLQLLWTPLYLLLVAAPYFVGGLAVALLLGRAGEATGRLYAWDLAGAGAGCAAVLLTLPALGGSGAVVASAGSGALSGVAFAWRAHPRVSAAAGLLGLGLLALAPSADHWAPISITANKASREVDVAWTRWDAFSRVELLRLPGRRIFRIDGGTAFSGIIDPKPWLEAIDRGAPARAESSLRELAVPFVGRSAPSVLVIGSGAGAEVLEALRLGADEVTALEINPLITEAVRDDPFWGDLFTRDEVRLHPVEGRSFLRRAKRRWDVIVSVHTISNAAMAAGAMALAESYVLTREAFLDYLDRLDPGGVLYVTRPEAQLPRLVATARVALEARGVSAPARHVYLWRERPRQRGQSSFSAGMVVRKTPFSSTEIAEMDAALAPRSGARPRFERIYPGAPAARHIPRARATELDIYPQLLEADDLDAVFAKSPGELAPATDDRPFFHHRTRWSALRPSAFADLFTQSGRGRMALEDRPIAEITLLVLLAESALLAALFVLLPLRRLDKTSNRRAPVGRWLLYFALLGISFIFVEIVLLQEVTLFLGRPPLTFAVVVGGLLVSSGCGSGVSRALLDRAGGRLRPLLVLPVLAVGLTAVSLPSLMDASLSWPLAARVALSVVAVLPVGFTLGLPLPLGLVRVSRAAPAFVPWAWAVNAFFTVVGTVLAMILGMSLGFSMTLGLAALGYGGAALFAPREREEPAGPSAGRRRGRPELVA